MLRTAQMKAFLKFLCLRALSNTAVAHTFENFMRPRNLQISAISPSSEPTLFTCTKILTVDIELDKKIKNDRFCSRFCYILPTSTYHFTIEFGLLSYLIILMQKDYFFRCYSFQPKQFPGLRKSDLMHTVGVLCVLLNGISWVSTSMYFCLEFRLTFCSYWKFVREQRDIGSTTKHHAKRRFEERSEKYNTRTTATYPFQ